MEPARTTFSLLLAETEVDSDWKLEDRLRIDGHKPSGALLLNNLRVPLRASVTVSRTGVVGLEDGEEGVEGLEDVEKGSETFAGVDGLLLAADCARLGRDVSCA